jgi:two-component system, NarL family, sensor histidine kinase DegS
MMKNIFNWSKWSIATKILFLFLGLMIIAMGIIGVITNINIRHLGDYALETSTNLGQRAIEDSTNHLNQLGEEIIKQKSKDVAKQVEMYLESHPWMSMSEMRVNEELREIVVQPVGTTGYTTLIDPVDATIIIHKFPGQEKNLDSLKDVLPTFWALLKSSAGVEFTAGYYDWLEVDGSINQKYAGIETINIYDGLSLNLWATTYIKEFSVPAALTEKEINAAIAESGAYLKRNVLDIQNILLIIFTVLALIVTGLALLLSRVITRPIQALKKGAESIGHGDLDFELKIKNQDELGDLANSFNIMASDLKNYTEELKNSAVEKLEKERQIQENLHMYVRKVGQAQEDERKRIARELHDETIQALVVVSRELEDLATGNGKSTITDTRNEIRKIIDNLRRFSQELRPSILDDLGLIPAVKWLASEMKKSYGIKVETEITGSQHPLSPEIELMIFRITQEALTNVRRHSQASKIEFKLAYQDKNVNIIIRDDGKGFKVPDKLSDLTKKGKLGLVGIQERAELLGGTVKIDTMPGKGTTLSIDIPLQSG